VQSVILPFYKRYLEHSSAHLDIGPGSGFMTAQRSTLPLLNKLKHLAFLDPNPRCLHAAASRAQAAGYRGPPIAQYTDSVLAPLPSALRGAYDSVALFGVLHTIAGTFPTKASHVAATVLPALAPGPDSAFYGATVLGAGVRHNVFGRALLWALNYTGMMSNYQDSVEGLRAGLRPYFEEVEIEVVGATALFVCRGPKSQRISLS
jgi:hypothetical protein